MHVAAARRDDACGDATDAAFAHIFAGGADSGGVGEIDVYDVFADVSYPNAAAVRGASDALARAQRLMLLRGARPHVDGAPPRADDDEDACACAPPPPEHVYPTRRSA